jgi:hypothetical protein
MIRDAFDTFTIKQTMIYVIVVRYCKIKLMDNSQLSGIEEAINKE